MSALYTINTHYSRIREREREGKRGGRRGEGRGGEGERGSALNF